QEIRALTLLDELQQRAVRAALETPDICLIQALPGTGASGVVAEIIRQASQRGNRILFASPWPNALTKLLVSVGDAESISPWRVIGPQEREDTLAEPDRSVTLRARTGLLKDQTIPEVSRYMEATEAGLEQLQSFEAIWPTLHSLADRQGQL